MPNLNFTSVANAIDRFTDKVLTEPNSGCWLWTASINNMGYGVINLGKGNGVALAHRFSYILHVGEIPDGLVLDHLCKTPICVNPKHLEAVTQKENCTRGECGKGGAKFQRSKTHCRKNHPYSPENTRVIPGTSFRECIESRSDSSKRAYAKKLTR